MAKQRVKYHREAMKLLGWTSAALRPNEARLVEVETRLGRSLPPSVREWIVYFGDLQLCAGGGQDDPVRLGQLGEPVSVTRTETYDAVADGYLILMRENQNCCKWAVALDGSDDPPVFQTGSLAANRREWEPVAGQFSEFTLARTWSMNCVLDARYNWLTVGSPFGVRETAYLRANMKEGPITTDWPGRVHHHFSYRGAYIWVFGHQWMAGSGRRSNMESLTRRVWWFAGAGAESFGTDFNSELKSLRAKPPAYPGPDWDKVFGEPLDERFANDCYLDSRDDPAVIPPANDDLLDEFEELSRRTFAGGLLALTPARPGQRIYLVTGDYRDREARSAWWLHGHNAANLASLARHSRRWGTLASTLRATTDAGREALRAMAQGD